MKTKSLMALLFLALAAASPAEARAGEVVAVRASDLPPFKALEEAFVGGVGQSVRRVSLAAPAGKDDLEQALGASPSLVLVVGPDAAKAVAALKPAAPLLLALVPSADKVGLDARTPVIPMLVTPARQASFARALLPKAQRLGVLYDSVQSKALIGELEAAASSQGFSLVKQAVASRQEVVGAARELLARVDVLLLVPDPTVISADTFKFIVQSGLEAKVPVLGFSEGMAKAGALAAFEAGYPEMGRKAAAAAKRILAGGAAAPEPPEPSLFLNAKAASVLGIALPESLRRQSARVFE